MALILFCIVLIIGKSVQQLDSEEVINIIDKLIGQIKNNTNEVNNATKDDTILDELNSNSPDQSQIIYLKTYNKPIIDFVPEIKSDVTDVPQEYLKTDALIPVQNETSQNDEVWKKIIIEIKKLNEDPDNIVNSRNQSKVISIKDNNNSDLNGTQDNTSDLITVPLVTQDTRRNLVNFSLPKDLLSLIKENHNKGIILKEIVVEIESNAKNNNTGTDIANQTEINKIEHIKNTEDVITTLYNKTMSDISTESSQIVIDKVSDKKLIRKKHIKGDTKKKDVDNSKNQAYMDTYLSDRTVPPEVRQNENKVLKSNAPQFQELNDVPRYNRVEKLESHPFLWRDTQPKPCDENCLTRKLIQYVYTLGNPRISYALNVTPRSTKLQIDRALQDTYSVSKSLLLGPTYYTTNYMNRIRSRLIYKPLYNKIVYL